MGHKVDSCNTDLHKLFYTPVVGPIVTGFIVGATGHFEFAMLFTALLLLGAVLNYIFYLGKIEPMKVEEKTA